MAILEPLLELVKEIAWPAAIVFLVLWFRKTIQEIAKLVAERLQKVKGFGVESIFGSPVVPEQTGRGSPTGMTAAEQRLGRRVNPVKAEWKNIANIYWLGHDLATALFYLLYKADKRFLLYILSQCRHHVRSLKFESDHFEKQIGELYKIVEGKPETALNAQTREKLARDILLLRDEIGAQMEVNQPDFQPWASQHGPEQN